MVSPLKNKIQKAIQPNGRPLVYMFVEDHAMGFKYKTLLEPIGFQVNYFCSDIKSFYAAKCQLETSLPIAIVNLCQRTLAANVIFKKAQAKDVLYFASITVEGADFTEIYEGVELLPLRNTEEEVVSYLKMRASFCVPGTLRRIRYQQWGKVKVQSVKIKVEKPLTPRQIKKRRKHLLKSSERDKAKRPWLHEGEKVWCFIPNRGKKKAKVK
jgi:hypothetical protein